MAEADIAVVLKAFAEPERIKVVAAIVDASRDLEEIVTCTGLKRRAVQQHLGFLLLAGLLKETNGRYRYRRQPLIDALHAISPPRADSELEGDLDAFDRKTLSIFLVDGKLTTIPAQQKKRDVILRFLAERFEPDQMYDEREVNAIIREYHADVASLRRYMVDGGFLQRQIVRVVSMEALTEGRPEPASRFQAVEHRISYWRNPG